MPTCISCGFENDEIASFCLSCGADVTELQKRDASANMSDMDETKMGSQSDIQVSDLPDLTKGQGAMYPTPMPMDFSEATSALKVNTTPGDKCSVCETVNMKGMKFCGNCGSPMGDIHPGRTQALPTNIVNQALRSICKLVSVEMGGKEGPTFMLDKDETMCGRSEGDILFYKDRFVSPTHCTFSFKDGKLIVTDNNSVNGIYRRTKTSMDLLPGDNFRLGQQVLRLDDITDIAQGRAKDQTWLQGSLNENGQYRIVQLLPDNSIGEARIIHHTLTVIGREVGNILFPEDGFVSSQHCQVEQKEDGLTLTDMGSSNGTYLRIREQSELVHGDFILIGDHMLRVEILG
jgi:pSer/pThr/pTyr-binding forkhead associated (FHA) protein